MSTTFAQPLRAALCNAVKPFAEGTCTSAPEDNRNCTMPNSHRAEARVRGVSFSSSTTFTSTPLATRLSTASKSPSRNRHCQPIHVAPPLPRQSPSEKEFSLAAVEPAGKPRLSHACHVCSHPKAFCSLAPHGRMVSACGAVPSGPPKTPNGLSRDNGTTNLRHITERSSPYPVLSVTDPTSTPQPEFTTWITAVHRVAGYPR